MTLAQVLAGITRGRQHVTLALLLVLFGLVPLAHATPPDQTWLTGLYDAGDFDEAVVAVVSATAIVNSISLLSPKPADVSHAPLSKNIVLLVAAPSSPFTIRAPPNTRIAIT